METRSIGDYSDVELFGLFLEQFGAERAVQLMGWAVLWGVTGRIADVKGYREELMRRGLARSSAYRATLDFKRFREAVEGREFTDQEIMPLLERLSRAGVPTTG